MGVDGHPTPSGGGEPELGVILEPDFGTPTPADQGEAVVLEPDFQRERPCDTCLSRASCADRVEDDGGWVCRDVLVKGLLKTSKRSSNLRRSTP
jgi:hypothetical protein